MWFYSDMTSTQTTQTRPANPMDIYWTRFHMVNAVNKTNRDWERTNSAGRLTVEEVMSHNARRNMLAKAARHMDGLA